MEIQVGTILELKSNTYIIKEWIDDGGNGTTWKAEITGDSREYAVKILKDGKSKEKDIQKEHELNYR